MLDFFYKSIDTLKEVKKPTKDEIIKMTIAVLVVVFIASIIFITFDYLFLNLYDEVIYKLLSNL